MEDPYAKEVYGSPNKKAPNIRHPSLQTIVPIAIQSSKSRDNRYDPKR